MELPIGIRRYWWRKAQKFQKIWTKEYKGESCTKCEFTTWKEYTKVSGIFTHHVPVRKNPEETTSAGKMANSIVRPETTLKSLPMTKPGQRPLPIRHLRRQTMAWMMTIAIRIRAWPP
jgi:hypothetical protein